MSARGPSRRYESVRHDWRAILPETKAAFFEDHSRELENTYLMLSISLDEAIAFRRSGQSAKAFQAIGVAPELSSLLACRLSAVLHSMRQQARHFGVVPNLAPLDIANFRTELALRSARLSSLLSHVLLSERSQFLHKVSTLQHIVRELTDSFIESAERLAEGQTLNPAGCWQLLDRCHFDLNTCLRETVVLLKSLLLVLPEDRMAVLDFTIRGLSRTRPDQRFGAPIIHARRIAAVARK